MFVTFSMIFMYVLVTFSMIFAYIFVTFSIISTFLEHNNGLPLLRKPISYIPVSNF